MTGINRKEEEGIGKGGRGWVETARDSARWDICIYIGVGMGTQEVINTLITDQIR